MRLGDSVIRPELLVDLAQTAAKAPAGCFVEIGVYKGGSAFVLSRVARERGRELYLYDTFTGIPYADVGQGDDVHVVGDFGDGATVEELQWLCPWAIIHAGVFPNCPLPTEPVAFVHLDCDQYQSYTDSIAALRPLLVKDARIVCDDYCLLGANRAIHEAAERYGFRLVEHDHRATLIT